MKSCEEGNQAPDNGQAANSDWLLKIPALKKSERLIQTTGRRRRGICRKRGAAARSQETLTGGRCGRLGVGESIKGVIPQFIDVGGATLGDGAPSVLFEGFCVPEEGNTGECKDFP